MNRLTLAQSLREKCGITGSGPSTTLSQTGEMLRVVNWIDEAWLQIQTLSDWWQWMRGDFSFDTIAAQREYVPSASPLSLTNFARWYTDPDHTWRAYLLSAGRPPSSSWSRSPTTRSIGTPTCSAPSSLDPLGCTRSTR